ncbi:acyl-CoA thioester hydrolase/BAAT C-terminal domain-containing protein [Dyadobacter sp. CY323]|uniref:acyl-CoA thioester hydrolase/BAAT C-terminal domain-containing protein n=1 Tax=Dyadobacter sp. CY323 TaxID=2907302 RepID=UPI001F2E55E2|nr:acyl-CoA thioester hydrolase/BAAT C-terminal domain-containing protein [Dyadobacter sp. CY323]MCE6989657.1 hypothetical protein [Dyadobacter sp. CY323]
MDLIKICKTTLMALLLSSISFGIAAQKILNTPRTRSKLYLGRNKNQPLIVGLGGSEGGNAWASEHWKKTRDAFIQKGYAFLAVGYFGAKGTPDTLDRIALEDIQFAISEATKDSLVNPDKIAIIGGSRGGDLALLLGSYYPDIKCIVALVPSHAAFPGHTSHFSTSAWTYRGKELPFVPVNEESIPFLYKRDLRGAFETMLKDTVAESNASIKIENINGPIFLISANKDEIAPTTPMCEKIVKRLKNNHFKYNYEHVAVEGGHAEPLKHFDEVFRFLERNFE